MPSWLGSLLLVAIKPLLPLLESVWDWLTGLHSEGYRTKSSLPRPRKGPPPNGSDVIIEAGRIGAADREEKPPVAAPALPHPASAAPSPESRTRTGSDQLAVSEIPSTVAVDNVHFSITGPSSVPPGAGFSLQFWVHFREQQELVLKSANTIKNLFGPAELLTSEGPFELQRGARLSVGLSIDGLEIRPPHKLVHWVGEIGNAGFTVQVPKDAEVGPRMGSASIRVNGSEVGRLDFVLYVETTRVQTEPGKDAQIPATLTQHRKAFASYASEDRDAVLARIQGMQKAAPQLEIFVDVISLRSGQYWEQELWKVIPQSDVMYLFWCRHASKSEWVNKEWRCALKEKGLNFIDPVPLEGPDLAPPPPELAARHFNDPLLAYQSPESLKLHAPARAAPDFV